MWMKASAVKKGDLIAELDRKELEANLAATKANVPSLEAQVNEANHNYSWTNEQTGASLMQAQATRRRLADAQLEQARAQSVRAIKTTCDRMQKLFEQRRSFRAGPRSRRSHGEDFAGQRDSAGRIGESARPRR